ncbi:MAG: FAD-dependent oxidoreductase [Xanthomonadaceae bacterium]|nr:FAD-dependent oxidoreductase [Xanthomonadaceae bacterium]
MSHTPWMRVVKSGLGRYLRSTSELNRRDFIKISAKTVALGIIATQAFPLRHALSLGSSKQEVTVVGGGIAGLTSAYRLATAGFDVSLFEAQARLGGRIFTLFNSNKNGQFLELGGEFIDTDHKDILALARELGLEIDDFRKEDAGKKHLTLFFEGKLFSEKEFQRDARPVFKKILHDFIEMDSSAEAFEKLNRIPLDQYLNSTANLNSWVKSFLKTAYESEYGIPLAEQSALGMVTLLGSLKESNTPYGTSDESMRIRGGNSQLISALEEKCKKLGVKFFISKKLERISGSVKEAITLDFGESKITSKKVILTLPLAILRKISGMDSIGLKNETLKAIQELGMGNNSKSMMEFSERVWRTKYGQTGNFFSDQDIHCAWETSRAQKGETGILTHFLTGVTPPNSNQIPAMLTQIEPAIPGIAKTFTKHIGGFSWSEYPYASGSYSCPKLGQWVHKSNPFSITELNGKLYFAGEHCSVDHMGYMNGAVESANLVATQVASATQSQNKYSNL